LGPAVELPLWVEYVRALAPAGAFVVALVGALTAWRSHVRQKLADRHEALWTSMVWAVAQVAETDDVYQARMGMSVLTHLAEDPLVNPGDNDLLAEINAIVAERIVARDFAEDLDEPEDTGEEIDGTKG
jgi:hypothetical protein